MTLNRFQNLPSYPFVRMRALFEGVTPRDTSAALNMALGEPQHAVPEFVMEVLHNARALYHKYPPVAGTEEWLEALVNWHQRRYGLTISPNNLVPLSGSREGIFALGPIVIPEQKNGKKPVVLLPNPFYQPYAGAAAAAGAEVVYVNSLKENGFLPDYEALDPEILSRTALAFMCSPSNPEGAVADMEYLKKFIKLARKHDFVAVGDECYSEIYGGAPPPGILQAAAELGSLQGVLSFNSLSKRSNLAGLRSAFMAGDADIIAECRRLRSYGGATMGLPVLAASAAAWNDEAHVEENRAKYRRKFDLAERYLGGKFDFYRPEGGFCLWLNVGDGIAAAQKLWQDAGIRVLPGAYLAGEDGLGHNPGLPYIRLVLVHNEDKLAAALEKIADTL